MPVHQAGVFIAQHDCNKFGANPRFDKIGSTRAELGGNMGCSREERQGKIQCWESNFNMFWSNFVKVGRHIFENL